MRDAPATQPTCQVRDCNPSCGNAASRHDNAIAKRPACVNSAATVRRNANRTDDRFGLLASLASPARAETSQIELRPLHHMHAAFTNECCMSLVGAPFEKEAFGQDGRSDVVNVRGRHAGSEEALAPLARHGHDLIDLRTSRFG